MDQRPDARSDARERALYLLYEADSKQIDPNDVLAVQLVEPDELTTLLVQGVAERHGELDTAIGERSSGWTLERMPMIDLTVLRLGLFELIARPEVPIAVIIDEAVELAKRYSTDDSGRFVNGVLAALARDVRESPTEPGA